MIEETKRLTVRIPIDDYERIEYWAKRRQLNINEYINEAIQTQIKKENGDTGVPDAITARVNQMVDLITELSSNMQSLEQLTISGFDSLLGLTRGDNYLLEHEDGEI